MLLNDYELHDVAEPTLDCDTADERWRVIIDAEALEQLLIRAEAGDQVMVNTILARPYRRVYTPEPDGGFYGEIPELPGCITQGVTAADVAANLEDAAFEWVSAALKSNIYIPDPQEE